MGEVACAVCRDTGELQDSQAWDCGQSNSECPYCPHKVDEYRKEIAALREALGLLTTLPGAADVECGVPPLELAQAIHAAVSRHIEELGLACLGFQP